MLSFNAEILEQGLRDLGIQEGDLIFLHSDLMALGIPHNTWSRQEILTFYWDAFQRVLGRTGTLATPAYFYEYARLGEPFDTERSSVSKSLGAFSAYACAMPGRIRSCNPLQSIVSIGYKAKEISGGDSLSGYGVNSPWHRLRQQGGKIVFLGVDMEKMTYVHYIEQLVGVPHLYFKVFNYPVYRNGKLIPGNPVSAVRYLDYDIEYHLKPFEELLFKKGHAKSVHIGNGKILIVGAEEAYQEGIKSLEKNIYFFLKSPPKFLPGKIPYDGVTGKSIKRVVHE